MLPVLKFTPIYKSVLWGGTRICRFKGVASEGDTIGESWELSPMPGHESVVAEGPFAGRTLNNLVEEYPEAILGANVVKRFGANFPLLIKFIDSTSDLSIQVHPDDALAAKRHNSLGKTEMWYSVLPTPDAYLYAGFSQEMTPDKFRAMVADSTIVDALSKYYTKPGDVFFLPAGRVHAIGRGNFVLEIQEASDITYRIYDYGRLGNDGKPRELHVEDALDVTKREKYTQPAFCKANGLYSIGRNELAECSLFKVWKDNVSGVFEGEAGEDSFVSLLVLSGSGSLTSCGETIELEKGRSIFLPAGSGSFTVTGEAEILETRI